MHNQSKNTKATNKQTKKSFFMTSWWRHHITIHLLLQLSTAWFWRRRKKIFPPKISRIFRQKYIDFHPQTSILQFKPKKLHKKRIIARTKQALIFEISSNELQKSQNLMGFAPTIFSTSFQQQSGLKTENQHQTRNKNPKKMASTTGNGKPKN